MNHYLFKYAIDKCRSLFLGKRVSYVSFYSSSLFSISFKGNNYSIYIDLSPSVSFLYPFDYKEIEPDKKVEIPFFSFIKKKLIGCKLTDIKQEFSERVATFVFKDVRGDIVNTFYLVFEVMDRNTNAIFLDSDMIILQAYKYIDSRNIQQKKRYYQLVSDMPDLLRDDIDVLLNRYKHGDDILGFSLRLRKLVKSEIQFVEFVKRLREVFNCKSYKLCKYNRDVYPFCFLKGGEYIDDSYLFNFFIIKPRKQRFENEKHAFVSLLNRRLKSLTRRLNKIKDELNIAEDYDRYRIYAENLLAHPIKNTKYVNFVCVDDVYGSGTIKIYLNPELNLFDNAQAYFRKYKKLKKSVSIIENRIRDTEMEIKVLEQLIFDAERAKDRDELNDIKRIAISEKLIREHTKQKKIKFQPYEHLNISGFDAYVGKNARGNDIVALKLSSKSDLWFHARNRPSAHLVLKLPSKLKDVPESVKIKAAEEVACRSKAMIGEKVEIDYTKVKNLKKPKGFRVGMVLYTNFKTLTVEKGECS